LSDKTSDKPREFLPVKDPVEAIQLLKESARTLASAMIWTKNQSQVISTTITVYDRESEMLYAATPTDTDVNQFMEGIANLDSSECFFSVSLARANIFFRARYLGHDSAGFRFRKPESVFKVQRRKDMRVLIPFGHVIRLEMQDPTFPEQRLIKKIYDISASGLAFIANDSEEALFHVGLIIKALTFSIGTRKISLDAEVRHVRVLPPDSGTPGTKVGVLFKNIKPADNQWIAAYVFEESRKFITKYV
jgi:hypothetical protein